MTYRDLIKIIKEKGVEFSDLKFTDLPGLLQHFTIPVKVLTEELFIEGRGFDGSSIRGFQSIDESDMLLKPDMNTVFFDPFTEEIFAHRIDHLRD